MRESFKEILGRLPESSISERSQIRFLSVILSIIKFVKKKKKKENKQKPSRKPKGRQPGEGTDIHSCVT